MGISPCQYCKTGCEHCDGTSLCEYSGCCLEEELELGLLLGDFPPEPRGD